MEIVAEKKPANSARHEKFSVFIYLFIYSLFKVDKFTIKTDIIQYTNKNSNV